VRAGVGQSAERALRAMMCDPVRPARTTNAATLHARRRAPPCMFE